MLDDLKFIHARDKTDVLGQLEREAGVEYVQSWRAIVPSSQNLAKQLALELLGTSVVIICGPSLRSVASSWQSDFRMRAQQLCWLEIALADEAAQVAQWAGWHAQPEQKPYRLLQFNSSFEFPAVQQALERGQRLLSGRRPEPIVVEAHGDDLDQQQQWLGYFGQFVTTYTALLNNTDATGQAMLEKFRSTGDNT